MRHSVSELVTWMSQQPRTLGWSAVVAFDRARTNSVLLQEYIGRFSGGSGYFPPFSGTIDSTPTELDWIYDYIVDSPRLSFENASLDASHARLSMQVLGGSQVTISIEYGRAEPTVIKVAEYDALQGPRLTMDIDLRPGTGTVDSAGKVELDLGLGSAARLHHASTSAGRERGGAFMLNKLQQLGPDIRVFALGELASHQYQFLKPEHFAIRTHAEPGANAGEGAVLLFITMQGEANGTLPVSDADLMYLIPAGPYSAVTLLSNRFLLRQIVVEGLRRMCPYDGSFSWEPVGPEHGFTEGIKVTRGLHLGRDVSQELPSFSRYVSAPLELPMGGRFELVKPGNMGLLRINWSGITDFPSRVTPRGGFIPISGLVGASWQLQWEFVFELLGEQGELKLIPTGYWPHQISGYIRTYVNDPAVSPHFPEIRDCLRNHLRVEFDNCLDRLAQVVEAIDIFRLNSLLFKGANVVQFKSVHFPGDLALFGQLAPDQTHFAVDPLEPLMGHGKTLIFKTVPEAAGVTWSVAHIDGGSGNAGSINPQGEYRAPPASEIQGFFIRVRVTASKGAYFSSALVTVLVRDIVVNPFIQVCHASTEAVRVTRDVAAGSLASGVMTWSVTSESGSTLVSSTDPQAGANARTFVAGLRAPGRMFALDEVIARDSAGRTGSSWVLVIHGPLNAHIVEDRQAALPEGRVQLLMDFGLGPIPPETGADMGLKWTVLKGGGHIDEATGLYRVDPASSFRFALITATIPPYLPGYPSYNAYIILPLPLLDLSTLRTALSTSQRYFKTASTAGPEEAAKVLDADQSVTE